MTSRLSQRLQQLSANTVPRSLAPLLPPPVDLRDLPLITVERPWNRIYRLANEPAFWGRTGGNRFDAPSADYGVLYAAETFDGAFIETFGDLSPKTISVNSLTVRGLATVTAGRPLRLVDFIGPGLSRLGLDARICSGDHAISQDWSRAVWAHPLEPDGISYTARHDASERSVAIFERASSVITVARSGGLMDLPQSLVTARALDK